MNIKNLSKLVKFCTVYPYLVTYGDGGKEAFAYPLFEVEIPEES